MPIHAEIEAATGIVTVVFDEPLVPGAVDASNWAASAKIGAGQRNYAGQVAVVTGATVSFTTADAGIGFPPDAVFYAATPADIVCLNGCPAAAFADFPLTVV